MPVNGAQAATGFMETAFSVLILNATELGLGTHNFLCNATIDTPSSGPIVSSAPGEVAITVKALLQNISIVPGMQTFVLDGNSDMIAMFNCSVEANPRPVIEWRINGESVQQSPGTPVGGLMFTSTLALMVNSLGAGVHDVLCLAHPNVENVTSNSTDYATINVYSKPIIIINLH